MVLPHESAGSATPESVTPEFPKLSTTLLEFAGPLLDPFGGRLDARRERGILQIAWLAWNLGAPRVGPDDMLASARARLEAVRDPEAQELVRTLIRRRSEVFGDDPRTAGELEITERDGEIDRLRVPTVDTPALRAALADPGRVDPRAAFHPSFAAFLRANGLDHRFLSIGVPAAVHAVSEWDRRRVRVRWRAEVAVWDAPPLADLFRGDAVPPSEADMSRYPARYVPLFFAFDAGLIQAAAASGRDPLDREVHDIVSALRRRPDGAAAQPAFVHDVLWQHLAVELARARWSAAEFVAVLRQIERSIRRHRADTISREYVAFVRDQLAGGVVVS